MELKDLSDEELNGQLNAILAEQERRANLARIPGQIEALRTKFIDGGGNPAELS